IVEHPGVAGGTAQVGEFHFDAREGPRDGTRHDAERLVERRGRHLGVPVLDGGREYEAEPVELASYPRSTPGFPAARLCQQQGRDHDLPRHRVGAERICVEISEVVEDEARHPPGCPFLVLVFDVHHLRRAALRVAPGEAAGRKETREGNEGREQTRAGEDHEAPPSERARRVVSSKSGLGTREARGSLRSWRITARTVSWPTWRKSSPRSETREVRHNLLAARLPCGDAYAMVYLHATETPAAQCAIR